MVKMTIRVGTCFARKNADYVEPGHSWQVHVQDSELGTKLEDHA